MKDYRTWWRNGVQEYIYRYWGKTAPKKIRDAAAVESVLWRLIYRIVMVDGRNIAWFIKVSDGREIDVMLEQLWAIREEIA